MLAVISSAALATVWMLAETWTDALDALAARSEVSEAPWPIPCERMVSCSEETARVSAVRPISPMLPRRLPSREPSPRSEEHTSELQSLMRNSYAVFCLKKKKQKKTK